MFGVGRSTESNVLKRLVSVVKGESKQNHIANNGFILAAPHFLPRFLQFTMYLSVPPQLTTVFRGDRVWNFNLFRTLRCSNVVQYVL